MAAGDKYKVTCSVLNVRNGAGVSGHSVVGTISNGDIVVEESSQDVSGTTWIKHDKGGWSSGAYLALQTPPSVTESTENSEAAEETEEDEGQGYQPEVEGLFDMNNSTVDNSEFAKIKNVAGVFGLPYQFLPATDLRLSDSMNSQNIGYEYAERIIERIPLLFIAPGKANFMTKYSKKNKESVLEHILTGNFKNEENTNALNDLISGDGRYYTFEYDRVNYYKIVNPMCRIAARFMGVQDEMINGTKLDKMNWESFTKSGISSIGDFGNFTSIPFYLDAESLSSVSESYGNSTTQSMIASAVNSVSDMGRELSFLLGTVGANTGVEAIQSDADVQSNIQNIHDTISKLMGKGNFLNSLADHLSTVAAGGKLVFPEIWADSTFSRSYSCEFKFISPDPSPLSVYLNVIVPLLHLMGLVAPQTVKENPNGYVNPFLVRAIYKGFFNIDTGIITDMSVTKGAECQWTPEGVPTSISVSITIKDLYNMMSITSTESTEWKFDTLNNTALMDYIANLCGINIFKPEIVRMIDMWFVNNFSNRISDFFTVNIWGGIQQKVQNAIMRIYR